MSDYEAVAAVVKERNDLLSQVTSLREAEGRMCAEIDELNDKVLRLESALAEREDQLRRALDCVKELEMILESRNNRLHTALNAAREALQHVSDWSDVPSVNEYEDEEVKRALSQLQACEVKP